MRRTRYPLLFVISTLVIWHTSDSQSQVPDPCQSTASAVGTPAGMYICPAGDGQTLAEVGVTIDVTVRDGTGTPIPLIPAADFWLIGWSGGLTLWVASLSSTADANTDVNGHTTISNTTIAGGGSDTGLGIVCQGFVFLFPLNCFDIRCLSIEVRSPDIDGTLEVDLVDLGIFAMGYPPQPYDPRIDFDFNGVADLVDLAIFALHYNHVCP